jgi:tetratricopeptide (TPR) repeat protein
MPGFTRRRFRAAFAVTIIASLATGCGVLNADLGAEKEWRDHLNRAASESRLEHYPQSEAQFKEAVACAEKFGTDDPRLARTLVEYARVLITRDEYREAEAALLRAKSIYRRNYKDGLGGERNRNLAEELTECVHLLANIYRDSSNAAAESEYREALNLAESALSTPVQKFQIVQDYAEYLKETGRNSDAEHLLSAVSELAPAVGESADPKAEERRMAGWTWDQVWRAAEDARSGGNLAQAQTLYLLCVEKLSARPRDPHTKELSEISDRAKLARSLTGLGRVQDAQHRYAEAEASLQQALKVMPPQKDDEDMINALIAVSHVFCDKKDLVKAEQFARKAAGDYRKLDSSNSHILRRHAMDQLVDVLAREGKFDEAKSVVFAKAEIERKFYGPKSEKIPQDYDRLGQLSEGQKDFKKAEEYYRKALDLYEHSSTGPTHNTVIIVEHLASLLKSQGRDEEARKMSEKVYEWIGDMPANGEQK